MKEFSYLLIVDVYSNYPEVIDLKNNITSNNVILNCKSVFARHGKPEIFYSDNGPQFACSDFKHFMDQWGMQHKTSTPTYAQSNGFIKRQIQTIKKLMKKAQFDNKDMYISLLEYSNTPLSAALPSPAQLLFGRKLNRFLPVKETLLQTKSYLLNTSKENYTKDKHNQYDNMYAKNLPVLQVNDNIVMWNQNTRKWEPGVITGIDTQRPRSYVVKQLKSGRTYIRNRRFLKKCNTNNFRDRIIDDLMEEALLNDIPTSETDNTKKEENRRSLIQYGETINIKENEEQATVPDRQLKTRSGRVVRKPNYLNDYVK